MDSLRPLLDGLSIAIWLLGFAELFCVHIIGLDRLNRIAVELRARHAVYSEWRRRYREYLAEMASFQSGFERALQKIELVDPVKAEEIRALLSESEAAMECYREVEWMNAQSLGLPGDPTPNPHFDEAERLEQLAIDAIRSLGFDTDEHPVAPKVPRSAVPYHIIFVLMTLLGAAFVVWLYIAARAAGTLPIQVGPRNGGPFYAVAGVILFVVFHVLVLAAAVAIASAFFWLLQIVAWLLTSGLYNGVSRLLAAPVLHRVFIAVFLISLAGETMRKTRELVAVDPPIPTVPSAPKQPTLSGP